MALFRSLAFSRRSFSTLWEKVPMGPKDPILGVSEAFSACKAPQKLNLGVGAYRDDNGLPVVLECVKQAEGIITEKKMNHEYGSIEGTVSFRQNCVKLALGSLYEKFGANCAPIQTLSGTGALRLGAAYLKRFSPESSVLIPNPSWSNHASIFGDCGTTTGLYRYYNASGISLDIVGLLEDLEKAKEGTIVILHASAHNPTGIDPTPAQWDQIKAVCLKRKLIPFFDMAYQGFASGDVDKDAYALRSFLPHMPVIIAQSFAKNFGLYGERVGCLTVTTSPSAVPAVESQLKILARAMYSNPPIHGSRIVDIILSDPKLTKLWLSEVKGMADRIISMRTALKSNLNAISKKNWNHVTDQIGMFCYSGMTPEQVDELTSKYHIYLTRNGRISMAGVTSKNVKYLAESIHAVTK